MNIEQFSDKYRLKVKRDGCGDPIIPGRFTAEGMPKLPEYHNHIYDQGDGQHLAMCLMFATRKRWGNVCRKAVPAGFVVAQDGETEGSLLFDLTDQAQAKLALRLCGIKRRRVLSPAQLEAARKGLSAAQGKLGFDT